MPRDSRRGLAAGFDKSGSGPIGAVVDLGRGPNRIGSIAISIHRSEIKSQCQSRCVPDDRAIIVIMACRNDGAVGDRSDSCRHHDGSPHRSASIWS